MVTKESEPSEMQALRSDEEYLSTCRRASGITTLVLLIASGQASHRTAAQCWQSHLGT